MDVLAHSLWTNVMYKVIPQTRGDKKSTWWGISFGVLPDFASFTPIFAVLIYQWITGRLEWVAGRPDFESSPLNALTETLYSYTHSYVIFVLAVVLVWVVWKKFPWFLLGWALHISIDLFSHSKEFYPTPFLYPISGYEVNGIPWSHPVYMGINYALLLILYFIVLPRLKRRFSKPVSPPTH